MKKTFLLLISLIVALSGSASEAIFSYSNNQNHEFFGYEKSESCDIAIFIPGTSLKGKHVKGLRVAVPEGVELTNLSGWLTTELTLKRENGKYINLPDICSAQAEIQEGLLSVTFDKPYTITSEGFFAGYSFTQASTDKCIATIPGVISGGLWVHGSRSKMKWASVTEDLGLTSAMEVVLESEFAENAASWELIELPMVSLEEETLLKINVVNYGLKEIESINYSYTTPACSGRSKMDIFPPIPAILGAKGQVEICLGNFNTIGTNEVKIEITEVNGQPNGDINPYSEFTLTAIPFIPVNRPLFEEYTGLWCGWCPRGYVAMEAMKEMYPDHFVGISYHQDDAMEFVSPIANASTMGLPTSFVNRSINMDPGQIYSVWENYRKNIPDAAVEMELYWAEGENTDIKATSTVRFVEDHENAEYRVGYILIADGLTNDLWLHANNYSGQNPEDYPNMPMPWAEVFFKGPKRLPGLEYNDISIAASDFNGVAGSLPITIEAGRKYTHTYTFSFSDLEKSGAADIIKDFNKLRVVAVVINARTGEYVNCVSSSYIGKTNGIGSIFSTSNVVEIARFTIDGRKINTPQKGINIIRYSDGTSHKVLVK